MTGRLDGKTALITGAAQGIGRETAAAFAREGAEVIAVDIKADELSRLSHRDGIRTQYLDVTDCEAVSKAACTIGRINILFNCVGYVHHGAILDCAEDAWNRSFDINVTSMYRMIRAFLPAMLQARDGTIINMSSVVSSLSAAPNRCAYSATKAAIIGLTKAVARDYVDKGIRCNAICPGTVNTLSWEERISASANPDRARADFIARQPMGRVGTVQEISSAAIYLASDDSAFMTGTTLVLDGGMSL